MNAEQKDCVKRMRAYVEKFTQLMGMIDKPRLTPADVEKVRAAYRDLKDALKADLDKGKTATGRANLNQTERQYFDPAIREASSRLHAATNSHPIKSKWHSELYSARMDVEYLLNQLERQ